MDDARETVGGGAASVTGAAVGMGSAATAAAVSACCAGPVSVGPLVISVFGAGGAVTLEGLRPYTAPLLVFSGLAVGVSFWLSARSGKRCSIGRSSSVFRVTTLSLLWASCAVWLAAFVLVVWARFA
jgi:hypothetical protein